MLSYYSFYKNLLFKYQISLILCKNTQKFSKYQIFSGKSTKKAGISFDFQRIIRIFASLQI